MRALPKRPKPKMTGPATVEMTLPPVVSSSRTLANGLQISAVHLPHTHRVSVDLRIAVGPRYETATENGISHFLEHMLYRGIPAHPTSHAQALAFESLGAELEASTYLDHGALGVSVPPSNVSAVLPLLAEVYRRPVLEGIAIEKGIVREEILEELDEKGRVIDPDVILTELCFAPHPLGLPITGRDQEIESFELPALRGYHEAMYVGKRTTLSLAGPMPAEQLVAEIAALFGDVPAGAPAELTLPPEQTKPRTRWVRHHGSQAALRVGFRAPGVESPLEPATKMLLRLLDDGMSTRLYQRLCNERGLCYDVSAEYETYVGAGVFDFAAESAPERAHLVLAELFELIRRMRDDGPAKGELDKARARVGWYFTEILDDPSEVASFCALGALTGGAKDPAARARNLAEVTEDDVRRAASALFRRENLSVVGVGPFDRHTRTRLDGLVTQFA